MINFHLVKGELKQNIKNLLIWMFVVLVFTLLVMAFFPSIKNAGADLSKLLESMPQGLLNGMGMDDRMMTTSLGFYKVYYGVYIVVIMGIYLFFLGATIFTKEEARHTIEFMMSKPLSRKSYFFSKCFSTFILFLIMVVAQAIFALISLSYADSEPMNIRVFLVLHVHGSALLFFFLTLGVLSSVLLNPLVNFMGIAVGIVFGSYMVNALAQGAPDLEWLGYLSPFYYANFDISNPNYALQPIAVVTKLIIGIVLVYFAYSRFKRRDFLTL